MQRFALIAFVAAACCLSAQRADAGPLRHYSLLRHYGPRGVYPAHYYDYYAPPTGYGHLGWKAYQGFGVGYGSYPYPYRAYYAGYGYGGYKTGESYPFFNHYGYPYPPQMPSSAGGQASGYQPSGNQPRPAVEEDGASEPEPAEQDEAR